MKILRLLCFVLNLIGIAAIIYFAMPLLSHNMHIINPEAMLPFTEWERSGFILSAGLLPISISNLGAFLLFRKIKGIIRFLLFVPAIVCLILVLKFWLPV